jgi:periplasmic divalent cation tolerance protein
MEEIIWKLRLEDLKMKACIVITTCASREEADQLATEIVENRLAACVQISEINSTYTWEGEVAQEAEFKLVIKTRRELYEELEAWIREQHSYDVPEIILVPVETGSAEYLDWIEAVTA